MLTTSLTRADRPAFNKNARASPSVGRERLSPKREAESGITYATDSKRARLERGRYNGLNFLAGQSSTTEQRVGNALDMKCTL